jgi:signal transduction histidine kinase
MTVLRPRLRGLVSRLALFYVLLSLPTLIVVESAILIYEFAHFMHGIADGRFDRAAESGASDLASRWPGLRGGPDDPRHVALRTWLDAFVLRLQQPRGGLTPDESYVLMELADAPLAAAIFATDGRELARSTGDGNWGPTMPDAADVARAAQGGTIDLPGAENPYRIRRVLAPIRTGETTAGVLFVELRLPLPWRRFLLDSSFESPTVLAFLIVFGIASSIFLAWWVTRRLNRVASAATAWSRGDFSQGIGDRSRDELGGLSSLLDRMALDLRSLMRSRAQLAMLAERQRLARDLHDTVKQKAFALNLQLATARRVIGDAPGSERLDQAQRLTQQIQQELAQILDELRASDAELPLPERVRARAIEWSHTSGIVPGFALDDLPPLPRADEESLLRILDEALANVLRHAAATRLDIALRRETDRVHLAIEDNGRGIAADRGSGMGLGNMRERAEALPGGRFELDTSPGKGTRVAVSFVVAENPIA